MKEIELRIGNLVLDSTKTTTIVESIIPDHNRIRYPKLLDDRMLLFYGFDNSSFEYCYVLHFNYGRLEINILNKQYSWLNGFTIKKINYVHELQNLYFALTGEEITTIPH